MILVLHPELLLVFITSAAVNSGWDLHTRIRKEVTFTRGRIIVKAT